MVEPVEVFLERVSTNDTEATVVDILAHSGENVEEGQLILVVETSKASQEIHSPVGGIIKHDCAIGDVVKAGSRVAEIVPINPRLASLATHRNWLPNMAWIRQSFTFPLLRASA
jgi:2-oxoglutarate dehydrogenase E2 component (dihydrolipoamide succinyltransferase)